MLKFKLKMSQVQDQEGESKKFKAPPMPLPYSMWPAGTKAHSSTSAAGSATSTHPGTFEVKNEDQVGPSDSGASSAAGGSVPGFSKLARLLRTPVELTSHYRSVKAQGDAVLRDAVLHAFRANPIPPRPKVPDAELPTHRASGKPLSSALLRDPTYAALASRVDLSLSRPLSNSVFPDGIRYPPSDSEYDNYELCETQLRFLCCAKDAHGFSTFEVDTLLLTNYIFSAHDAQELDDDYLPSIIRDYPWLVPIEADLRKELGIPHPNHVPLQAKTPANSLRQRLAAQGLEEEFIPIGPRPRDTHTAIIRARPAC